MNAPRLNRKLSLEAPAKASDGAGGFSETWTTLGELWADITARTGREREGGEAGMAVVGYRIVVRGAAQDAPSRPLAGQRFREGDRVWRILAVADYDPEGRYLSCFANEETAA